MIIKKQALSNNNFDPGKILAYCVFALGSVFLITYLWIVISRVHYPFELEWIEGGILEVVHRVIEGESIYVEPSIDFVPFLYPPLYFYLSAGFSKIFGFGFFPLRFVSFLASTISFSMIFLIVRDEVKDWRVAFFSMSLFAASFRVTGAWLDIARVDSLFLMFYLSAVYFARKDESSLKIILAGILSALAILTKQTGLILCVPIGIYLLFSQWKRGLIYSFSAGLIVIGATIFLNLNTDGWYSYYVYTLLSQQTQWMPIEFIRFWKDDLLVHMPIATLMMIYFFMGKIKQDHKELLKWSLVFLGALLGTFISRVKIGGYDNVLLPMFSILSILAGLGLGDLYKKSQLGKDENKNRVDVIIHIACLIQLIILFYNPFVQIPSENDLVEGERILQMLTEEEAKIYIPDHGYLSRMAGRNTYAHHAAIWDVLRTDQITDGKRKLTSDLDEIIQQQVFDIIIMDETGNFCCKEIDTYYTKTEEIFQNNTSFYPVTGDKRRPTFIYVANRLR